MSANLNYKVCGLTALGFVGRLANFVRVLMTISLLVGGVVVGVVAAGVLNPAIVSIPLYVFMVVMFIGSIMILFDASMAKYLVEVVLNRLSIDVLNLERIEHDLRTDLSESKKQIDMRDVQLKEGERLLEKQHSIVVNNALQLESLKNALQALLTGGHDMTAALKHEIDRLCKIVDKQTIAAFKNADANADGFIDANEWQQFNRAAHGELRSPLTPPKTATRFLL